MGRKKKLKKKLKKMFNEFFKRDFSKVGFFNVAVPIFYEGINGSDYKGIDDFSIKVKTDSVYGTDVYMDTLIDGLEGIPLIHFPKTDTTTYSNFELEFWDTVYSDGKAICIKVDVEAVEPNSIKDYHCRQLYTARYIFTPKLKFVNRIVTERRGICFNGDMQINTANDDRFSCHTLKHCYVITSACDEFSRFDAVDFDNSEEIVRGEEKFFL